MFCELATAQIATYLLNKTNNTMPILKLLQLMYLADREKLNNLSEPITGDTVIAIQDGLILKNTNDIINGYISEKNKWGHIITNKNNNTVTLSRPICEKDFTKMSDNYIYHLDKIFEQFGYLTSYELTNYTKTLPEWKDPKNEKSITITPKDILIALNKSSEEIEDTLDFLDECDSWDKLNEYMCNGRQ